MCAVALVTTLALLALGWREAAHAQTVDVPRPLASLKSVPVPEPANLGDFVRNRTAAIALGKALFWDMQAGSDGVQACASCHFHAGADNRSINQLNPDGAGGDATFKLHRPNAKLAAGDFPTHKLAFPDNRFSTVLSDANDVVGSQGVFDSIFIDVTPGKAEERVAYPRDAVFNVNGVNTRRVTGRNTPSNINAVFNFRNFWDGRAQNDFNGVNPFGSRDPRAYVIKATTASKPEKVRIRLDNAALASQAVGPALSPFEMSGDGRTFEKMGRKLGKKLQQLDPLAKQLVSRDDSVLGKYSRYPQPGISRSYRDLIQEAFVPDWWSSNVIISLDANGDPVFSYPPAAQLTTDQYTLMEFNFSLFWGLAIQMYESTLVSDDTPFDRFMEGNFLALTDQEQFGLQLFRGKGKCNNCHGGAELTNASVSNVTRQRLERMLMGDGHNAVYDNGFYNIGVRPTAEDVGVGGSDPFGAPLSEARMAQLGRFSDPTLLAPVTPDTRVVADGAFKTPGLRNVALTAPYDHNGGQLTLRQVVEFYARGGDFHEANIDNLDPDMDGILGGMTQFETDALVAFLEALTDERVRYQAAPFDHPQLFVPNGHPGNEDVVTDDGTGKATDQLIEIPMSGARGLPAPAPNFLDPPG
ncbi:MAG TPA: cytochrome c peroxidase [Usitatibacter sp.]|nr:cytochrome c peroxidase [Usitatibacter sp.]